MSQSRILVIGSGMSGLYSSIALAQRGHRVTVVEKANSLGGLLGSRENKDNDSFDYGTHFISTTGCKDIDDILTPSSWREDWLSIDVDRAGHYFNGVLDENCTFVRTNCLSTTIQQQCNTDLLAAKGSYDDVYDNLQQQIVDIFGECYYRNVFAPSLHAKFAGAELKDFVPNCHIILGLKRLAILSAKETLKLKADSLLDSKISFHANQSTGASLYYPQHGGVGDWVNRLTQKAMQLGVVFKTSTNIQKFIVDQKRIIVAEITQDDHVLCDQVICTIPPGLLVKLVDPSAAAGFAPPRMVPTYLINLTFDVPPIAKCAYFFNHDPNLRAFRVTLYSNFQPIEVERHRVTVEVLGGSPPLEDVKQQLVSMGVISSSAKLLFEECTEMVGGFPYFTHDLEKTNRLLANWCANNLTNVKLVGRSSGAAWLMADVLQETHESIKELL